MSILIRMKERKKERKVRQKKEVVKRKPKVYHKSPKEKRLLGKGKIRKKLKSPF